MGNAGSKASEEEVDLINFCKNTQSRTLSHIAFQLSVSKKNTKREAKAPVFLACWIMKAELTCSVLLLQRLKAMLLQSSLQAVS